MYITYLWIFKHHMALYEERKYGFPKKLVKLCRILNIEIQGCIKKIPDWTYRLECMYLIQVWAASPSKQSPCAATH